jgi:Prokaryotic membrane lipoprotein lipid attachment site
VRRPLVLAVLAAALAGCGSSGPSDEELVARTVVDFGRATATKDYATLCDRLLSPSLIDDVEQIGLPCEQALRKALGGVRDPRLTVGTIRVDGDRATADIRTSAAGQEPSRDTLRLERVRGTWRIASLGG